MFRQATVIIIGSISLAAPALANIDLELRPLSQTVSIGDTVNVGLYAVSDDDTDQLLQAVQVIISWDPNFLQLLGNDDTGAVPLLSSGFPANDPFNVNEVVPPQDGDGMYVAFAPFGNPTAATPQGIRLTTFQFLALADTPQTLVDILASGGNPEGGTIVFDGTVPNLDVTGDISAIALVTITQSSCPAACVWDVDFSGDVRVPDLIKLLGCWGPLTGDPVCVCLDIDTSGDIRVPDLIALLGEWGVCP